MRNSVSIILVPLLCAVAAPGYGAARVELIGGDIKFFGTVEALPCSIVPGTEKVSVNFGTISTKTLISNGKSATKAFSIQLQDCSSNVWDSVTVTFNGDPAPNMTNRLAITAVAPGTASGIGIGLQETDGSEIQLGQASKAVTISDGAMQLDFAAFVEADPQAVQNGTLAPGKFTATANYTLNYQ